MTPSGLDPLIICALAHAQFETVHPFLDGNGRVGRLLITFLLCHAKVLRRPVLYLSSLSQGTSRHHYYDRLMAIRLRRRLGRVVALLPDRGRDGIPRSRADCPAHRGAAEQLRQAALSADMSVTALKLFDHLFEHPIINVKAAQELLKVSFPAANGMISDLQKVGILTEITGGRRNRMFRFDPYLDLFADVSNVADDGAAVQPTQYGDGDASQASG